MSKSPEIHYRNPVAPVYGIASEGVRLSDIEIHFTASRRQRAQLKETLSRLMDAGSVEVVKGGRYRWVGAAPKASPAGIPGLEGELRLTQSGHGFVLIERTLQECLSRVKTWGRPWMGTGCALFRGTLRGGPKGASKPLWRVGVRRLRAPSGRAARVFSSCRTTRDWCAL